MKDEGFFMDEGENASCELEACPYPDNDEKMSDSELTNGYARLCWMIGWQRRLKGSETP